MKVESINVEIPEKKAAGSVNGSEGIDFSQLLSALMAGIVPLSNNTNAEGLTDAKTSDSKLLNLDAMAPACKDAKNLNELSRIMNSPLKADGQGLAEILNSIKEQAKNIESQKLPDNPQLNDELSKLLDNNVQLNSELSKLLSDNPQLNDELSKLLSDNPQLNNKLSKLLDDNVQLNDELGKLADNVKPDGKITKDNLKQMIDTLVKNEGGDNSGKKEDLNLKIDNEKVKPETLNEEKGFNNKFIKIDGEPELKEEVIMPVNSEMPQTKIQENEISLPNIEEDKNTAFIKKPSDLVDLTVTKFKSLRLPEYTELRVKLKPESLGEITVKLVLEKGHINGSILASRPEVAETLQNSTDDILDKLKENNIFLNHLSVNVNSDNHDQSNERQFERFKGNRSKTGIKSFEEMVESQTNDEFNIIA